MEAMGRYSSLLLSLVTSASLGCNRTPSVEATVRDLWGNRIPGATIRLETEQFVTNDKGQTKIPVWAGEKSLTVSRSGYFSTDVTHSGDEREDGSLAALDVRLYPELSHEKDIFLVGDSDYERLDARPVQRRVLDPAGNEEVLGLQMPGVNRADQVQQMQGVELVWASSLDFSTMKKSRPSVRMMRFVEEAECGQHYGADTCRIELHLPEGQSAPGTLVLLGESETGDGYAYLYRLNGTIEKGWYALDFNHLFESSGAQLSALPAEHQQAFPFLVK